jgi:soluble lytic murein transglycosylase
MPTVPTYDSFQATPTIDATNTATSPNDPNISGQQIGALADATSSLGSTVNDLQIKQQEKDNTIQTIAAHNALTEYQLDKLYNPQGGVLTLRGEQAVKPDANGITPVVQAQKDYQQKVQELSSGLQNDAQRQMFTQAAAQSYQSFDSTLMSHQASQKQVYQDSILGGAIELSNQTIAANPTDSKVINAEINKIKSAIYQDGTNKGLSGNQIQANINIAASSSLKNGFDSMIQNGQYQYAQDFLNKYKGDMNANDSLAAQGIMIKANEAGVSASIAGQVVGGGAGGHGGSAGVLTNTPMSQMNSITAKTESGNKDTNADGSVVTSPKGAQGRMQVMPTTKTDPGFGIKPSDGTPEDTARVGRDYLAAMMKRYSNDPAKAWAAYNWGPGNMDAYIKTGKGKNGNAMPQETINYVNKNMEALAGDGGAAAVQQTQLTTTQAQDQAEALARKQGYNSPSMIASVRDAAAKRLADVTKSAKETNDAALNNAYGWIAQNPTLPVSQMPASISSKVAPEDQGKLNDYGKKLYEGEDITTAPQVVLKAMIDDNYLKNMSANSFANLVAVSSASDAKALTTRYHNLTNESATAKGVKKAIDPTILDTHSVDFVLKPMLDNAKIAWSGKHVDAERLSAIKIFAYNYLSDVQRELGKPLHYADIQANLNNLFATNQTFRNTFMGMTTSMGKQPVMTSTVADIPSDIKEALTKNYQARTGQMPTDGQLLLDYFKKNAGYKSTVHK